MPIGEALKRSLRATGNRAFEAAAPAALEAVRAGDELTAAIVRAGVFPDDFVEILAVAEASGSLSEVMAQQAGYYHEEAQRRLAGLSRVAAGLVWALVGLALILAIFRLYGSYIGSFNQFL
jgi:type II secretory pathway component PulF